MKDERNFCGLRLCVFYVTLVLSKSKHETLTQRTQRTQRPQKSFILSDDASK